MTPVILVTNDDGYDAPGIHALIEGIQPLGRVVVVAPDREQSAASHAITLDRPLRVYRADDDRYRVNGTPSDYLHLAIHPFTCGQLPDLVVSGINRGLNVGDDVTYSGTVAGALEGTLLHVPSIAFSAEIDREGRVDFTRGGGLIRSVAQGVLEHGLDPGVLLNVNFPADDFRGIRITRQGTRSYRATAFEREDPSGRPYYWIAGMDVTPTGEPDGDHLAIRDGFVSITPLQVNLTHEPSLDIVSRWNLESNPSGGQ
jgi:5'-nucleotidase